MDVPENKVFLQRCKIYIEHILGPKTTAEVKKRCIDKMAHSLEEITDYPEYREVLKLIIRRLLKIIISDEPHFITNHPINLLRKSIFEFFILMPRNELREEHIAPMLYVLYKEFSRENEENSCKILKLIRRYHIFCRDSSVRLFISSLKSFYERVSKNDCDTFNDFDAVQLETLSVMECEKYSGKINVAIPIGKESSDFEKMTMLLLPASSNSFKVLAQIPGLLKSYLEKDIIDKIEKDIIREFIDVLIKTILMRPEKDIRKYSPAMLFMASQVKTLIFLYNLLHREKFLVMMLPDIPKLVDTFMYLFQNLPHDAILLRKELLRAIEGLLILKPVARAFIGHLHEVVKDGIIHAGEGSLRRYSFTIMCKILLQSTRVLDDLEKASGILSTKFYDGNLTLSHRVLLCITLREMLKKVSALLEKSPKNVMDLLLHLLQFFVMNMTKFVKVLTRMSMQGGPKSHSTLGKKTGPKSDISFSKIMKNYKENKKAFDVLMGLNIFDQKEQNSFGFSSLTRRKYNTVRCYVQCLIDAVKEVTLMLHRFKYFENFPPEKTLLYGRFLKYGLKLIGLFRIKCQSRRLQQKFSFRAKVLLKSLAKVLSLLNPALIEKTVHIYVKEMLKFAGQRLFKMFTQVLIKVDATTEVFGMLLFNYFLDHVETFEHGPFNKRVSMSIKLGYFADSFSSMAAHPKIDQMQLPAFFPLVVKKVLKFIPTTPMQFEYFEFLLKLFRSLKARKRDCIFHEFVSSLSYIVQTFDFWLNISLKPQLKNILLELCLRIPVHFFALNTYLKFVFRATVSALNGPHRLIVLALGMLEEIFLKLQWNEFQCYIVPVKEELVAALNKTAMNHVYSLRQTACRILGYFDIESCNTAVKAQKVNYRFGDTGPSFAISFRNHKSSVSFPISKVIDAVLRVALNKNSSRFYCFESWKVIKGLLCSMLNNFAVQINSEGAASLSPDKFCFNVNEVHRSVYGRLVLSMFLTANSMKKKDMVVFCKEIVIYCTLLAVNIESMKNIDLSENQEDIDPFGLIDALFDTRLYEEGCLTEDEGCLALSAFETVIRTAVSAVDDDRFCDLKLFQFMTDKMCFLCYEESSTSKLSGCLIILFFVNKRFLKWIYSNLTKILKAVLYAVGSLIFDATEKRIDYSRKVFDALLLLVFDSEANEKFPDHQLKAKACIKQELFAQLFHADECIRKQTMNFLKMFAEKSKMNLADIIKPYSEALRPKIFLPVVLLRDLPSNSLVALLDVLVFCMKLDPPVFKIDAKLFEELLFLCDSDKYLQSVPEYKLYKSNIQLINAALKALSVCISDNNKKPIFSNLCKALSCDVSEIQNTAIQCLRDVSPLLENDSVCSFVESLIPNIMKSETSKLNKFSEIFYTYFLPEIREKIMKCFEEYFDSCKKGSTYISPDSGVIVDFIDISCLIGVDATSILLSLKKIIFTVFDLVNVRKIRHSSPMYESLTKLLRKYPKEALHLLIEETCCYNEQMTSFLEVLLNDMDNKMFLEDIQQESLLLVSLLTGEYVNTLKLDNHPNYSCASFTVRSQCLGIRLLFEINRRNGRYLSSHLDIAEHLTEIWTSNQFQKYFTDIELRDRFCLKSYRMIVWILLNSYKKNPSKIELLFQLIQAFVTNTSVNLKFLSDFLLNIVAKKYSVAWKRKAFFKFLEIFSESSNCEELMTKILKLVFIPSFSVAFCLGEAKELICDLAENENIFVEFIDKIIGSSALGTFSNESKIIILQFSAILTLFGRDYLPEGSNGYTQKLLKFASSFHHPEYDLFPFMKYHSYVLLLAILGKTASHQYGTASRIFQDVLKANDVDLKPAINSTLRCLFPDLSHAQVNSFTERAIKNSTEDLSEYYYILKKFIDYSEVYAPFCRQFVSLISKSARKLASSGDLKKKTVAVDLVETIIKWKIIYNEMSISEITKASSITTFESDCDPFVEISSTVVNILLQIVYSVSTSSKVSSSLKHSIIRKKLFQKSSALLTCIFSKNIFPHADVRFQEFLKRAHEEKWDISFHPTSICNGLNLLLIILKNMEAEDALLFFTPLQCAVASLLWYNDMKVVKTVCLLINLILTRFPCDKSKFSKWKSDKKFKIFYLKIYLFVRKIFQKRNGRYALMKPSLLYPRIIVLSVVCHHHTRYIDSFIIRFLKALMHISLRDTESKTKHRRYYVTKEYHRNAQNILLTLCLVTKRLGAMKWAARKIFFSFLLLLAETSRHRIVLKKVMEVFPWWIKRSIPSHRQRILQYASMVVFKLFSRIKSDLRRDPNLNSMFYSFTVFLLKEKPKNSYIVSFLQHVIFYGWMSGQSKVREICSSIMYNKCKPRLEERLECILHHKWSESTHFWITHFIEFLFGAVERNYIQTENFCKHLFAPFPQSKNRCKNSNAETSVTEKTSGQAMLPKAFSKFLSEMREIKTIFVLRSIVHFCHVDPFISQEIWFNLFPKLWKLLAESQHNLQFIIWEIIKFLCLSGLKQVRIIPNPIETFIEAALECVPRLPVSPAFYKVIVRRYGLEKRSCLLLEDLFFDIENEENLSAHELKEASRFIASLYSSLGENDLLSGLWQKHARFLETRHGMMFEQEGNILKARQVYADALEKYEFHDISIHFECQSEYDLWQSHWTKCSAQLGDWTTDFCDAEMYKTARASGLSEDEWKNKILEAIGEPLFIKQRKRMSLDVIKSDFRPLLPDSSSYLFSSIEDFKLDMSPAEIVTAANCMNTCMLPEVMTIRHKLLLQTAQLLEKFGTYSFSSIDRKRVIFQNVWKNLTALPSCLSFSAPTVDEDIAWWSNVMLSVEKMYQKVCFIQAEDEVIFSAKGQDTLSFKALASKCAYQWSLKSARFFMECEDIGLCQDILINLEELDVPLWRDIVAELKQLLRTKALDSEQPNHFRQDVFHAITSFKHSPHLGVGLDTSAFEPVKSSMYSDYIEDAQSSEVRMTWAEFLYLLCTKKNKMNDDQKDWQKYGVFAIECFLQNCTLGYQSQSFVPISKVLWLLSYDDAESKLASAVSEYGVKIPAEHWLLWIPQLLSLLSEKPLFISKILAYIGQKCPQDLFFPLRSFVLEHAEANKTGKGTAAKPGKVPEGVQLYRIILNRMKTENPSLILSLNRIADEMLLLKGPVYEHILKLLKEIRKICYHLLFQKAENSPVTSEISARIKVVVNLFMNEENIEKNLGSALQKGSDASLESFNNSFNAIKVKFCKDFYHYDSKNCDVHSTICKVDQYISMLSDLSKMKKRQFYLHDKTKYLCSLHYERQDLKMFAKSPLERYETVHIARFLPQVKLAQKGNTIARKLSIEGDNGKIYQYSLTFNQESGENRKIDRISNLQQVMNCLFPKIKNMAKKRLKFKIREAIFLNPHTCLMYEGDSAVSLFDIFEEHCSNKGIKSSAPLHKYYKSIQGLHEAGVINSEVLKRIFTSIQSELVPQNLLKDWVHHAHPCAADYWKFRTQFTHHAALLGMIEHVIGLSPQTPDFMYIQRSSGEMNFLNFRFSLIHEDAGTETERKVPFRLTSNICKFITPYGVWGTFGGTLLNAVECLRIQWWKIESVIKVLLMDELLSLNQKKASKSEIACNKPEFFISTIERSVCETYERIEPLSGSEKEHHVQLWKLISSAESCDNLSALDPFSYPWL